jgi:hypothetical protein
MGPKKHDHRPALRQCHTLEGRQGLALESQKIDALLNPHVDRTTGIELQLVLQIRYGFGPFPTSRHGVALHFNRSAQGCLQVRLRFQATPLQLLAGEIVGLAGALFRQRKILLRQGSPPDPAQSLNAFERDAA